MLTEVPTREKVRKLTREGWTVRDIARLLDISTQAVYWHLGKLKAQGVVVGGAKLSASPTPREDRP